MSKYQSLFFLVLFSGISQAKQWNVGPVRAFTKPSQVSSAVANGDTVLIDVGVYDNDVCKWSADNLVIKGLNGMPHMKANGNSYGGKAIWVISGKNTTVESIEFSLCSCVDWNGAGIRQEGNGLTVRNCYFHDNEDGILGGGDSTSNVLIEYCEFYNNGHGDGYSHNLYIGNIASLTFQYNYSHHAVVGHELKSRARKNYILYNRFADESDGTASRSMDLPNGGLAIIMGNEIQKGPLSQNSNVVEFGLEGLTNPGPQQFYMVNNTVVNERNTGNFFNVAAGSALCKVYNNLFTGNGNFTNNATTLDTSKNLFITTTSAGFVDAANMDYHLISTSPAINKGASAGNAGAFSLTPTKEYADNLNQTARNVVGTIDIGAHEFGVVNGNKVLNIENKCSIYPIPANDFLSISGLFSNDKVKLFSEDGREIPVLISLQNYSGLDVRNLATGIYFLEITTLNGSFFQKICIQH